MPDATDATTPPTAFPPLTEDGPPLRLPDIAPRLGYSYDHVVENWRDWVAAGEIPPPFPATFGAGRHPRWPRALWLRFERGEWPPERRSEPAAGGRPADPDEDAAAALDARIANLEQED